MSEDRPNGTLPASRTALDRLRDRTDELELIISSLTIFALLSLPGWLFDRWADVYTHLSTTLVIAGIAGTTVVTGVSYGLAACFVVHLMARAYWVGLIGLRYVFPGGIDWQKTAGLGPVSRQYYRDRLPDIDHVIQNTDKLASSLFAVISMLTLGMLWLGTILTVILVVSGAVGEHLGLTNAAMGVGVLVLLLILAGVPVLVWVLDALLARRLPRLREQRWFGVLIRSLRRLSGIAYPQRLVLPVQLTLQSNTRPVIFFVALLFGIVAIFFVGSTRTAAWRNFTLSGEFTFLDTTLAREGFISTYYEDMASPLDRLRAWPRIDRFEQKGSFVRLFLPYQPLRDNLVLQQRCGVATEDTDHVACLRELWTVSIAGRDVPMSGFTTAERADLKMRGLIGLVPLTGLPPGMQTIEVVWNPGASEDDAPLDDRYASYNSVYRISVAFAPDYELGLE